MDEFTSSERANGGREKAASRTLAPVLGAGDGLASVFSCCAPASSRVPSSRSFISSVRRTHPSGILQVSAKDLLWYRPLMTAPLSRAEPAAGRFTGFSAFEEEVPEVGPCAVAIGVSNRAAARIRPRSISLHDSILQSYWMGR